MYEMNSRTYTRYNISLTKEQLPSELETHHVQRFNSFTYIPAADPGLGFEGQVERRRRREYDGGVWGGGVFLPLGEGSGRIIVFNF